MADTNIKLSGTYDSIEAYNILEEMRNMSSDYEEIRTEAAAAASAATTASAAATNAVNVANTAVSNAQTYAGNANSSASDAAEYASDASTAAANAASSETNASNSATAAATSAASAAASEAVVAGALPLSGGTMTGAISFETTGEIGYRATTHTQPAQPCKQLIVSATDIDHWDDDGGAKLTLHTYDSTGTNTQENGAFSLIATDGTDSASLVGRKDGVLTWNDHNVFTSRLTTGTVTPLRGTLSYSYLNKTGNLVQCGGCLTNISGGSTTSWVSLVKLPAGFIPSGRLDFVAANNASGWGIQAYIDTDGTVYAWPAGGAITSVRWNVCYFVNN